VIPVKIYKEARVELHANDNGGPGMRRDVIEFCVRPSDLWYGDQIEIHINNENLINCVLAVELPFATAEGSPKIAGSYAGLPAKTYLPPSQHFLGVSPHPEFREGKVEVLICGDCGEFGCWPLLATIFVEEHQVTWKGFVQPHRNDPTRQTPWNYERLGPFVFERRQYEAALNAASKIKHPEHHPLKVTNDPTEANCA
jgi:hypothetical protein